MIRNRTGGSRPRGDVRERSPKQIVRAYENTIQLHVSYRVRQMFHENYDYYQCDGCTAFDASASDRRYCKKHNFVMPEFNDYLVCADWRFRFTPEPPRPFGDSLETNILYWWNELYYPHPVDRFELIQELRLHRRVAIAPHPKHTWIILIPPWDTNIYPAPDSTFALQLGNQIAMFTLIDAEIETLYTTAAAGDKKLQVEKHKEDRRVAVPSREHVQLFIKWIDRHFGIEDSINQYYKEARLLHGRIIGVPDRGSLGLKAGPFRESANSDRELDNENIDEDSSDDI